MFDHFRPTEVKPRDSLRIHYVREMLVSGSIPAAYNGQRKAIRESMRLQGDGSRPPDISLIPSEAPKDATITSYDQTEVVWGGPIIDHYGHFLCESVSRLWPLLDNQGHASCPVVLPTRRTRPRFVSEWLSAFGLSEVQLPTDRLVRFQNVAIPEPAWKLNAWLAPEMRDIHLQARRGLEVSPGSKQQVVWLSRSKLDHARRPYDEALLEWLLADYVTPICPESETLSKQVSVFEASNVVVGVVGSAFHTILMCWRVPTCVYLCPNRFQSAHVVQNQVVNGQVIYLPTLSTIRLNRGLRARKHKERRLNIPPILRSLANTVLPEILEAPQLAMLADPVQLWATGGAGRRTVNARDLSIAKVLSDPLNLWERLKLGKAFEEEQNYACASEQYMYVADLSPCDTKAPLLAARSLASEGDLREAEVMARRVLAIKPSCRQAKRYIA